MNAVADGNILKLEAGDRTHEIEFPDRVAQSLEAAPLLIVRTEPVKGVINNQNVYGVTQGGRILWRIEESSLVYDDSPYINLARKPDGYHAYDWDGGDTLFDPASGKILAVRQGK